MASSSSRLPDGSPSVGRKDGKKGGASAVPLTVYRQVVQELEQTKTDLDQIREAHQRLQQEHQVLQDRWDRLHRAAGQLRSQVTDYDFDGLLPPVAQELKSQPVTLAVPQVIPGALPATPISVALPSSPIPAAIPVSATPKPRARKRPPAQPKPLPGMFWVGVMLFVVGSAFAGGFFVVRPLLERYDQQFQTPMTPAVPSAPPSAQP